MLAHKDKKGITMQKTMLIVFVAFIVITVGILCFLIFSSWLASSRHLTGVIATETNTQVLRGVERTIFNALHVNEIHQEMIAGNIVDMENEQERERFFVSVLNSHGNEIFSLGYGTKNGEYYGARRNQKGELEIMRNNAQTGGHSFYYSVRENLTADELVQDAGRFDPRTREWYKVAEAAGKPIFSPVYRHLVLPEMSITAAWPVFNDKGELCGVL